MAHPDTPPPEPGDRPGVTPPVGPPPVGPPPIWYPPPAPPTNRWGRPVKGGRPVPGGPYGPGPRPAGRGLAVSSLVLGIASLVLAVGVIGGLPGVVGLILGRVALKRAKRESRPAPGTAIAGVAMNAAAIFIAGVVGLVAIPQLLAHRPQVGQLVRCLEKATTRQAQQVCSRRFQEAVLGSPRPSPTASPGPPGTSPAAVNARAPGRGGATWEGPAPVPLGPATAPLGSPPGAAVAGDGSRRVLWTSGSGALWEAVGTGPSPGSWSGPHSDVTPTFTGQPAVALDGTLPVTFAQGSDGRLWEGLGADGLAQILPVAPGPLGSSPSAVVGSDGRRFVFWRATDGHLWEGVGNGDAWEAASLGMGSLGSEPSAGMDAGGRISVVWKGPDQELWAAQATGSTWVGPIHIPGMGPLGSGPSIAVAAGGERFVFWAGQGGALREAIWDNHAWGGPYAPGIHVDSKPAAAIEATTGRIWIYYQGTGGALWQTVTTP